MKITLRSEDVPVSFAIDAYRIVKRVPGKTSVTLNSAPTRRARSPSTAT